MAQLNLTALKAHAKPLARYERQLERLSQNGVSTVSIESAVTGALGSLDAGSKSLVIYGEPQSGKTEMMICLTAKLLDRGHSTIVHLMNDSVDLHGQNLTRFKQSALAPAPVSFSELTPETSTHSELVVFCKKNARDLEKLIGKLSDRGPVIVIDDEADYATPNSKINIQAKTAINDLIGQLIGQSGTYLGVTATPARLDLNSTFDNDAAKWVRFPPHPAYTGQDTFFPLDEPVPYRRTLLPDLGSATQTRSALVRFLATSSYLNTRPDTAGQNYTMLVHTSGKKTDHESDRLAVQSTITALNEPDSADFETIAQEIFSASCEMYPDADAQEITNWVVQNISRASLIVLNSKRDRKAAGENAAVPTSPFTIIIGGNIVSRGVTFPNLLAMYFTRSVSGRLQQDTYIQRARMFGARGAYLPHFELTIPSSLYNDWHRCFVFHRLALETVGSSLGSPVWLGDKRISVASSTSINKATVTLDKGEMSFGAFQFESRMDDLAKAAPTSLETLDALGEAVGESALPAFLIKYLKARAKAPGTLAIHTSSSIENLSGADQNTISRTKGFIGKSQREEGKFPNAVHHLKIFRNAAGLAKVFYKYKGSIQFIQSNA